MVKLNNPKSANPPVCLLDSDVIINWLAQEEDSLSHKNLWAAPHEIMKLAEARSIKAVTTIVNLLEIRFVLRRKKNFSEGRIKEDLAQILEIVDIIIPDEVTLMKANSLQSKEPLSPFDAILVSVGLSLKDAIFVSRDKNLTGLASTLLSVSSPEAFLESLNK